MAELKDNIIDRPKKKSRKSPRKTLSLINQEPTELILTDDLLVTIADYAMIGLDYEEIALELGVGFDDWKQFYFENKDSIEEYYRKGQLMDSIASKRTLQSLAKQTMPAWKYRYEMLYGIGLNTELLSEEDFGFEIVDPSTVVKKDHA